MSEEFFLIVNITIALAVAGVGGLLASWLRQPPIAGYLAAGVAIGPFTPGFQGNAETIATLAEVGVIFLMFALGVSFSVKELQRVGRVALWATALQVIGTVLLGWLAFMAWQGESLPGLFMGAALAASSSMVMLKVLLDRGEAASAHGRLLLSMAIVQDLLIVLLIVLLPMLSNVGTQAPDAIVVMVLLTLVKAVALVSLSLLAGARLLPKVMSYITTQLRSSELFIVCAAVLALGMAALSASLGLSAALGAFLAGLMLSESEFDHRILAEIVPLRDLFATLFFVSVGMLIDVPYLLAHWQTALIFTLVAIAIKALVTLWAVLPFKLTPRTAAFTALGMVPIGELNFVLAQVGLTNAQLSGDSYKLILAAALLSIIVTPSLLKLAPLLGKHLAQAPLLWRCFDPNTQLMGHAGGLEAHAVVVGYGRVGKFIAEGLRTKGMVVVAVDSRLKRVRDAMSDGLEAIYGSAGTVSVLQAADIENARLIVIALTDFDSSLAVIRLAHGLNPKATISARAQLADDEPIFKTAGASLVIIPELAGANDMLDDTLDLLGMPR